MYKNLAKITNNYPALLSLQSLQILSLNFHNEHDSLFSQVNHIHHENQQVKLLRPLHLQDCRNAVTKHFWFIHFLSVGRHDGKFTRSHRLRHVGQVIIPRRQVARLGYINAVSSTKAFKFTKVNDA